MRCNPNTNSYSYTHGYTCDYANCYTYTNANANFDSYSNGNRNRDTYTYGNFDSRSNIYNYTNRYSEAYPFTKIWPVAKDSSHAPATAVKPDSQACHAVAPPLRRGVKADDPVVTCSGGHAVYILLG